MHKISEIYRSGPFLARLRQLLRESVCPLEKLVEAIPGNPSMSALDIGCGGGLMLALLGLHDKIGYGLGFDSSPSAIALAQLMRKNIHLKKSNLKLNFTCLSAHSEWPEGEYNLVLLMDVLHHIPPEIQKNVFHKALSKVSQGGFMVYKDMATYPRWKMMANQIHDLIFAGQWISHIPLSDVMAWASEKDFRILTQKTYSKLWYQHDLIIFTQRN